MSMIELVLDGDDAWPDLDKRKDDIVRIGNGASFGMAVLEHGMQSGQPSIAFRFNLPDGGVLVAETSWRLLANSVRAIATRYGWPG